VRDTKYSSKTRYTSTVTTTTTTTAAAAVVVLMRYVLALDCGKTDGTGGLN
jgi:hypothetical protein